MDTINTHHYPEIIPDEICEAAVILTHYARMQGWGGMTGRWEFYGLTNVLTPPTDEEIKRWASEGDIEHTKEEFEGMILTVSLLRSEIAALKKAISEWKHEVRRVNKGTERLSMALKLSTARYINHTNKQTK